MTTFERSVHGDSAALESPLRPWAGSAAAVAAMANVAWVPGHLLAAPYVGALQALLTLTFLAIAALLLCYDAPLVYLACTAVGSLALAGYVATRTVALLQVGEDVGDWFDPVGVIAVAAGAAAVALSLMALRRSQQLPLP